MNHFKSLSRALLILFGCFVFSLVANTAHAEVKIAVVDVQTIMSESKAAKSIQKQLEDKRKSYQKEVAKQEKDLKDIQDSVVGSGETISKEDLQAKREEFEKKLLEMRGLVQKRRGALELAAAKALQGLRTEVVKVVAELAEENKYTIVVTRQNVILAEKDLEITDEVMSRLNKKIKNIKLEIKE